jgi:hypothetical protein
MINKFFIEMLKQTKAVKVKKVQLAFISGTSIQPNFVSLLPSMSFLPPAGDDERERDLEPDRFPLGDFEGGGSTATRPRGDGGPSAGLEIEW